MRGEDEIDGQRGRGVDGGKLAAQRGAIPGGGNAVDAGIRVQGGGRLL